MPRWWIQGDCALIEAADLQEAFRRYRHEMSYSLIACMHDGNCPSLRAMSPERRAMWLAKKADTQQTDIVDNAGETTVL